MKPFDLQPHLTGELVELRPMRPDDWDELFRVASDPLIWEGHPQRTRYQEPVFREYFHEGLESRGSLVALDHRDRPQDHKEEKIIGASRYFWHGPNQEELEIGWTFLARSHWGGAYNGEMKRLMLDYAFQFVDKVIFRVGANNIRSQKAMKKIGAVLTDRRVRASVHGEIVESVIFEIKRPASTPELDQRP